MRVKICGITNLEDALVAIKAGADALGFVFYEKSPRYITPKVAKEICKNLPPFVERVGLFVNDEANMVDAVCAEVGISLAQLHFEVDDTYLNTLKSKPLPVVRAQSKEDILINCNRFCLVDAYVDSYGGEGKRLALEWFDDIDCSKMVIAGGLTPLNVDEVKAYGFYGVDVSSGVEKAKGLKDTHKVESFISNAKSKV
jgi:phosphoribosylanthranilate isomerase